MRLTLIFLLIFGSTPSPAVEMAPGVNFGNQLLYNGLAQSGSDPNIGLNIRVFVTCFSVDNVNAANPISRDSTIRMAVGLGPTKKEIAVVFPAWLATKSLDNQTLTQILVLGPETNLAAGNPLVKEASAYHGLIRIRAGAIAGIPPIDASGNYTSMAHAQAIQYLNFWQDVCATSAHPYCGGVYDIYNSSLQKPRTHSVAEVLFDQFFTPFLSSMTVNEAQAGISPPGPNYNIAPYGDYFWAPPPAAMYPVGWDQMLDHRYLTGVSDNLSLQIATRWSSDFKNLEIHAAFPGSGDICGGLYTPLMMFFDDSRPEFMGNGKFRINPAGIQTNWVEAGAPGYFLVLDRNGNGVIDDYTEMFGSESGQFKNGFEALRELDENGDGRIDARDPEFKNLRLWRDKNGDGISQPDEIFTLKEMGITSISLNYDLKTVVPMGIRAQLREKSKFTYIRDGKKKKGDVIDVWLSTDR